MKRVELYGRVRHAVMIEGLSQREAARCFGIDPRTVRKMLSYSVPPGYVRTLPTARARADREHAAEAAHLSFVGEAMHVGDRADQFVRFATEPGRMGATWSAQAVAVLTGWRAARLREL